MEHEFGILNTEINEGYIIFQKVTLNNRIEELVTLKYGKYLS